MGMFSEIATESTVKAVVKVIAAELEAHADSPETREALKKVGRSALQMFDWNTPAWAAEYEQLFAATPPEVSDDSVH